MNLNYKHLQYFWATVKEGGIVKAGERLHVTPQTVSGQIALLEAAACKPLLRKSGRKLALTEAGQAAFNYADEIFTIGEELRAVLRDGSAGARTEEFRVGVADAVPKAIAYRLLEPATTVAGTPRLICREWKLESLLAELAIHRLDAVIADVPIPPQFAIKAYNHKLGSSGTSFFATAALSKRSGKRFPACLADLPLLMPGGDTAIHSDLAGWLRTHGLAVQVAGEFDDGALMKAFGSHGKGVFAAPSVLEREIETQYGVKCIGRTADIVSHYYVISVQRRITHPCVEAIAGAARAQLFAN